MDHPRPQLVRSGWIDLCGTWDFAYDDARVGLIEGWQSRPECFDRRIRVPFPPESSASGIGDTSFHPVVWYRRTFTRPEQGERVLLHCGAIDYAATVWINGRHVASHEGGHTPIKVDITEALHADGEQSVVIRAEDSPTDLAQPRGKQDWRPVPHKIWYHRTTGIWQPIWLEPVATAHIADLRWTPDPDRGLVGVGVALRGGEGRNLYVQVTLTLRDRILADDRYTVVDGVVDRAIVLDPAAIAMERDQFLWSPAYPNLIGAVVRLLENDRVVDEVESYLGLRTVGTADGRFLLNGRPYFLRMVLEQGYWPDSHLAAPDGEALRREVELIKALGFNGVRIHQKVEDPRFLYWCDRLGLLVWGEMAATYVFSPVALSRLTREWLEVLARDYSHPCIVTWVPFNESWGVPNLGHDPAQQNAVRALYALTRAIDPTRPVIGNDGWEHVTGDIYGIHDYSFDGEVLRKRYGTEEALEHTLHRVQPHAHWVMARGYRRETQAVMITEYGGIGFRPAAEESWYGYGTVADADTYLAKYRELTEAILDSPVIVGFCYTQLTDTGQETNGLLTADRRPKLDPQAIRAVTTRHAASAPGDITVQLQQTRGTGVFDDPSPEGAGHAGSL